MGETKSKDREPEIVEVEVERVGEPGPAQQSLESFGDRLWRAVAPVLLALILDMSDLFTSGPLGFIGLPIGMLLGYAYAGFLGVPPTWRIAITVSTGVYFMLPLTGMIPVATITALVVQILRPPQFRSDPFV